MNEKAARRALDRAGQAIDLLIKSESGSDDYGQNYTESTTSTTGRVVRGGSSESIRDASGQDVQADAEVYVPSDVSGLTGGAHDGATGVDVDQDGTAEYLVAVADDQGNGLVRLVCEQVNA